MDKNSRIALTGLVAIVTALVSVLAAYLIPHIPLVWQISGAVSVLALIGYIVLDISFIRGLFGKKTARYGMNSVLMAVLGLFIVVFINMIANEYDLKLDVSKNKINTLSAETIKVLQGLNQDVTVRAFLPPAKVPAFEKLFEKYSYYTSRLHKDYIDVDKDPLAVQRYGIKQNSTVIIESESRKATLDNFQGEEDPRIEEKLTNGIIQVAKGEKRKIYFLKGHAEHSITDTGREGYSDMKASLTSGRYDVEELLLLDKEAVPGDADIIVLAGPKSAVVERELTMLEGYIKGGGKVLFMLDPEGSPAFQGLAKDFGVNWEPKKVVVERNKLQQFAGGNPLAPVVVDYDRNHEITRENQELSIFPIVSPIEKAKDVPKGVRVSTLFSSSGASMVASLQGNRISTDQKNVRQGPVSLAVAVTGPIEGRPPEEKPAQVEKKIEVPKEEPEFRAVFVGDSDFASNGMGRFGINADIFQNMLSWLAHEEDLISIRPKPTDVSEFDITEARMRIIHVASVFFLPLIMVVSGIAVWVSRRRK
ncbi:MAG: GldG family protein [Bdellovibrionales bacterium]|nr:GldG family protein [Bdellovibrionales bacterium]